MTPAFLAAPVMPSGAGVGLKFTSQTMLHILGRAVLWNWKWDSSLPDKLVSVWTYLQLQKNRNRNGIHSSRQMTGHTAWAALVAHGLMVYPLLSMQQRMHRKIRGVRVSMLRLGLFCWWTLWISERERERDGEWVIRKEVSKVIWSGRERRGEVWRLISVMCRDSWAVMSVAVTIVFCLTLHYLLWHWPLRPRLFLKETSRKTWGGWDH